MYVRYLYIISYICIWVYSISNKRSLIKSICKEVTITFNLNGYSLIIPHIPSEGPYGEPTEKSPKTSQALLKYLSLFIYLFIYLNYYLFIYFWLCWVFVSVWGLSPVAASGGHSSSRSAGLSLSWPLLLRSTGSRRTGSVVVAHGPSCSVACGIFPDQGSNPCPLHRQADSQPLCHQGSPLAYLFLNRRNHHILKEADENDYFLDLFYNTESQTLFFNWIEFILKQCF